MKEHLSLVLLSWDLVLKRQCPFFDQVRMKNVAPRLFSFLVGYCQEQFPFSHCSNSTLHVPLTHSTVCL